MGQTKTLKNSRGRKIVRGNPSKDGDTASCIQPATDQDIPELVHLVNASYFGLPSTTTDLNNNEVKQTTSGWTDVAELVKGPRINLENPHELRSSETVTILKFLDNNNGKIVGCVRLEHTRPDTTYMSILSVWPTFQSKGIGTRLNGAAENWARDRGCSKLEISVITQRSTLLQYYKRQGYCETGQVLPFEDVSDDGGIAKIPNLTLKILWKQL